MRYKPERLFEIIKEYDFKTMNYRLIIYTFLLTVIGILAINSATDSTSYPTKQIIGLVIGLVVMFIFSLIKYEFLARYYWLMYILALILLLAVIVFGVSKGGATRWINLAGLQVQPSEICKLLLLFFFSTMIVRNKASMSSWKFLILMVVLFAIPLFLIMKEPDFSTSMVFLSMFCVIMFLSNMAAKYIRRVIIVVIPLLAAAIVLVFSLPAENNIIPEYQYNRLIGFYDEDNEVAERIRYQQENSVIAIASGGTYGKGLNNNSITSVKNAEFISEPQTDFIFTIIGEELGFLGSLATIILIALIVFECFLIGIRARESIGRSIAIGYGTMLAIQAFINLGVVTMIIPNTGLTLPFVSYGLSSLITSYLGIGIVLNVGLKTKVNLGGHYEFGVFSSRY